MRQHIRKTYKPAELEAAIAVLQNNNFHNFEPGDARGIVIALYNLGYRVVYAGKIQGEPKP